MSLVGSCRYLVAFCALVAAVAVFSLAPASASQNPVNKCVACPVQQAPPPAPYNLRITHDRNECANHVFEQTDGGNLSITTCYIPNPSALIWDETGCSTLSHDCFFTLYVGGKRVLYPNYLGATPWTCCGTWNSIANGGCAFVRRVEVRGDPLLNIKSDMFSDANWIESANSNTVCRPYVVNPNRPLVPAPQPSH